MSDFRIIDGVEYERFGDSYVPVGEVPGGDSSGPFVSLAGLKARPVRWAWEGRIPLGVATLVAGVPGVSKTSMALHIGAKVTRGELAGDLAGNPRSIVVMCGGRGAGARDVQERRRTTKGRTSSGSPPVLAQPSRPSGRSSNLGLVHLFGDGDQICIGMLGTHRRE